MKNLSLLAIVLLLIFLPLAASSTLIPLSHWEMSQIIGQRGIMIEMEERHIHQNVDRYTYAYFDEGSFVTSNWKAEMHVNPDVKNYLVIGNVESGPKEIRGNTWTGLKPKEQRFLKVEVTRSEIIPNGVKCVRVETPLTIMHLEHASFRVGIDRHGNSAKVDKSFGRVGIQSMTTKVYDGKIEVASR